MAFPQPDSGEGEPVANSQVTTFQSGSIDQEPSGSSENVAAVRVAPDAPSTGDAQRSSRPKFEEAPPDLSAMPSEVVANGLVDRDNESVVPEMPTNHIAQVDETGLTLHESDMAEPSGKTVSPAFNEHDMAEASGNTVSPALNENDMTEALGNSIRSPLNKNDMAEASGNAPTQEAVPELMKSRTIAVKKKLFTTPKERAVKAAEHQRRLEEAEKLFQRSLIPKSPAQANPQIDPSRLQPPSQVECDDMQILEPGHKDSPISVDSEADAEMAANAFKKSRRAYERKQKKDPNSITMEDRITFCQLRGAEKKRLSYLKRKRAGAERAEHGPQDGNNASEEDGGEISDLFVSSPNGSTVDLTGESPAKRIRSSRANRVPDKAYQSSMRLGYEAAMASQAQTASKKPRKPKGSTAQKDPKTGASKAKDKSSQKDDASRKSCKKKRGPAKRSGPRLANIGSLLNNDIIADAQAIQGREGQAKFKSKNRKDALAELIASMPTEQQKPHTADKKALDDACKKFTWKGQGSMQASEGRWLLKGMKNGLMPHQLLGAAWMRDRENSGSPPYGGLVADSMGFGKTIQMLSNVLEGRPSNASPNQTTLVVCPASICSQWLDEVRKHIEPGLLGEVVVYRSGNRTMTEDPVKTLSKAGMVITSYSEVVRSYPHHHGPGDLVTPEAKKVWWEKHYKENRGTLHRIFFRRIILDEAQQIKNPKSKVSISCRGLIGKYKWMLTGTPILNAIEELWPYFDFLQVPHAGSFETFKQNFCQRTDKTRKRLDHMLNLVMLRRTLSDEMFGRPILKLPPIERQTVFVEFNPTERAIYNIVRTRFIKKISDWCHGGEIQRKFKGVWVMFLRLRQLCAHALLIQDTIKDLLEAEDVEKLWRITRQEVKPAQSQEEINTIIALRKLLKKQSTNLSQGDTRGAALEDPIEVAAEEVSDEQQDTGGQFGSSYKFRKYLRSLKNSGKWDEIQKRSLCHKCHQIPENPHVTVPCEHIYCKV